ncbi:RNA polymerase sigma-70 factor, ECF subfamily [Duganella sp. CF517]|uniref:RNA polymerase sigma factor n=1 Tax=Duganella sp. CF517 TaxID=1881038 RepID=UPI0008B61A44|nr:RNA polymerase sigma factor [Duganella sp. CF517]SEN10179.1 RNA polymerase sigma-70 factor, ECF subfamily [Duganella sp. CF517]
MDSDVVDWVTSNFLPFEAELRLILRRVCSGPAEIDDVVQEVYYKVLMLGSMAHVREPKAFLVRTAKNVVIDRLRREAIVSIEAMASLDELEIEDGSPSPERVVQARSELKWVIGLIANLPERCKAVFRARRIYGLSQIETAQTLGISEGIVEQETMKGMNLIAQMVARVGLHEDAIEMKSASRTGRKKNVHH